YQLSEIPGLEEAVAEALRKEEFLRLKGFFNQPEDICGLSCRLFTPRHMLLLRIAENPFVCGGTFEIASAAQFAWIISSDYSPAGAPKSFFEAFLKIDLFEFVAGIE